MKNVVSSFLRLWPGFSGVVRYGLWDQLGIALIFGAVCQLTLAANFLWNDFLSNYSRASFGVGAFVFWVFLGSIANGRLRKYEKKRKTDADGEMFLEAQTHYLRGNWFETECCLKASLKKNPYDAESLLLLATLYRHVKRFSEAKKTLVELEKLEASDFWYYEIGLEKAAIKNDEREAREEEKEAREAAKKAKSSTKTSSSKQELPKNSENETVSSPTPSVSQEIPPRAKNPSEESNVSFEKVGRNVATGRPILKFCLNASSEAATDDDAA